MGILFFLTYIFETWGENFSASRAFYTCLGFLMMGGVVGLIYMFPNKIAKIFLILFLGISIVLFGIDVFTIYHFNISFNSVMLSVVLQTNVYEGFEFLCTYVDLRFLMGTIAFLLLSIMYFYYFRIKSISHRWIYCLLCLGASAWGFEVFLLSQKHYSCQYRREIFAFPVARYVCEGTTIYSELQKTYASFNQTLQKLRTHAFAPSSPPPAQGITNIVLIIGESAQRNHLRLYGYTRATTPYFDVMQKSGNLLAFSDVVSPHAHTHLSLQKVLTFANLERSLPWYEEKNLVSIFKNAGYRTIWNSNQEKIGFFGNVAGIISSLADEQNFVSNFVVDFDDVKFDEFLIPYLKPSLSKTLTVVHLMGAHASYGNRYPKEYGVFSDLTLDIWERMRARYDNAILYNDYVVSEIFRRFSKSDSLAIYLSDHGEEVHELGGFIGHSDGRISRFMVEIPFMIYVSDIFIQKHPRLYERIKKAINRPYMTDDTIHTILDIAGIKVDGFDPTRSIINDRFNDKRKRIVGGANGKDYDKELKNQTSLY